MKVVDYTWMENKERDNITIKLSRRAKCSLTIVRADTVLKSTSASCFFDRRLFLEIQVQMDDCGTNYPSVPHWKAVYLLRTEPHVRFEQQVCSYCKEHH